MAKEKYKKILKDKVDEIAKKGFDALVDHIDTEPLTYECTIDHKTYQIEIECFYDADEKDAIRIIGSIDDGTLVRSMFPHSYAVLVDKHRKK